MGIAALPLLAYLGRAARSGTPPSVGDVLVGLTPIALCWCADRAFRRLAYTGGRTQARALAGALVMGLAGLALGTLLCVELGAPTLVCLLLAFVAVACSPLLPGIVALTCGGRVGSSGRRIATAHALERLTHGRLGTSLPLEERAAVAQWREEHRAEAARLEQERDRVHLDAERDGERRAGVLARHAIRVIRAYRERGPLPGATCLYEPSCSRYAETALVRFGFFRGAWLTTRRLLRCNPGCEGGHDPVPARQGGADRSPPR
jgi:uncharacterized protein